MRAFQVFGAYATVLASIATAGFLYQAVGRWAKSSGAVWSLPSSLTPNGDRPRKVTDRRDRWLPFPEHGPTRVEALQSRVRRAKAL